MAWRDAYLLSNLLRKPAHGGSLMIRRAITVVLVAAVMWVVGAATSFAQAPDIRTGDAVPRDVREVYDRGLAYLVSTQSEAGNWTGGGDSGAGVTGMALMCFLASGEDPNYGQYSSNIKRAVRNIITQQTESTGYFGGSMYHHGFAMLALAEAYGAVDDRHLWTEQTLPNGQKPRSIGAALELAVRAAVTSQKKNSLGAWRYSPDGNDADTSVAGAVLMGLLAARNAGIEVPDEAIDRAISYFVKMTADSGQIAYSGGLGGFDESLARISIGTLVYSIARRKDLPQFKSTLGYLQGKLEGGNSGHGGIEYQRYYQAQALFQGDVTSWEKWNKLLIRNLKTVQQADGSFRGAQGTPVATSLSLLALAVNYRFLPIYER
jgi:hypothetical protein